MISNDIAKQILNFSVPKYNRIIAYNSFYAIFRAREKYSYTLHKNNYICKLLSDVKEQSYI